MGKLGAATGDPTAVMVDLGALDVVNGPEDLPDWDAIKWSRQETQVRRLRQRIFKAAQAADFKQVRNLQKLMLRSRANTLVSVRRVTQRNTGRHTSGVDGRVALTSRDRVDLAVLLHRHGADVLRLKGLLNVAGVPTPVLINGVQHIVHPPSHLEEWPDADRRSRLVFIVRALQRTRIERSLVVFNDLVNAPAASVRPRASGDAVTARQDHVAGSGFPLARE